MKRNSKEMDFAEKTNYIQLVEQTDAGSLERICKLFTFFILTVFPFVIGPQLYINITEVKFYSFVGITALFLIAVIVTLIKCITDKEIKEVREFHLKGNITLPQVFITAYMIWGIISAIYSDYNGLFIGQGRHEGVLSMLLYGLIFVILSFWGEFSNRYLYGMAIMSILVGFFAFTQIMGSHFMYPSGYSFATSYFLSTIGNIDCVSGLISIVLPALCIGFILQESKLRYLSLAAIVFLTYVQFAINVDSGKLAITAALIISIPFTINSKRSIVRTLIMIATVLATAGIQKLYIAKYDYSTYEYVYENTHSKSAIVLIIIALLIGIVTCAIYRSDKEIRLSAKKAAVTLGIVLIAALIIGIIIVFTYQGSNPLLIELSAALHGNLADEAGSGRGIVWKRTLQLIGEHPIIGSGTGAFLEAFSPYNEGLSQTFDFAHNDFLQIAACQGIVGLVLYLGFLISLAVRGFKQVFKCPWVLIFISASIGYIVYSFFTFSIAIVSPLFWVMAGLLDNMVRKIPESTEGLAWPREELELIELNHKPKKIESSNKGKKSRRK